MKKTPEMITAADAKLSPFYADPSKYLTSNEMIEFYLNYILENGDIIDLKMALEDVAKAKGISLHSNIISEILKNFGLKIELKTT